MTTLRLAGGSVLVGDRFMRADLAVENGVITEIGDVSTRGDEVVDCSDRYIVPGLIDLQVMGGGSRAFFKDVDEASFKTIARAHAATGTTAMCPTVISAPPDDMIKAVSLLADLCDEDIDEGAAFVGIHIEGPFLSPEQLGRHQAEHLQAPSLDLAKELIEAGRGWVRIVTVAPELEGILPIVKYLTEAGVHVSAGHTNADADALLAAMLQGLSGVTHLFNCMPPLSASAPGPVGMILSSDLYAGVIGDLVHVARDTLGAVVRSRLAGRTYLTTVAAEPFGLDAEELEGSAGAFTVRGGAAYASDGHLVGSVTPLSRMVRNLIRDLEIPVQTAVGMATVVPAQLLRLPGRGEIRPGGVADLLVIQRHRVDAVILRGALLENFPNYQRLW